VAPVSPALLSKKAASGEVEVRPVWVASNAAAPAEAEGLSAAMSSPSPG
jgi:hypothetical protein